MTQGKNCFFMIVISAFMVIMIAWNARDIVYAADSSSQTTDTQVQTTTQEQTNLQDEISTDTTTIDETSDDTATSDETSTDTTTDETSSDATVILPTEKWGNHWIYDVDTPIDLYGADETTTKQIQVVGPESSFQVTYSQDNSNMVDVMTNVLSGLGTDEIDEDNGNATNGENNGFEGNLTVYFFLPGEVDTSGISTSSFDLEGFYSLFDIEKFDIEEKKQEQGTSYSLITVDLTSKKTYSSIADLLSDFQTNTKGKIILSGLSVPSSYNLGDLFYVSAFQQGTVNVWVSSNLYQFEAISNPAAGDDGMTDTFSGSETDSFRAHVSFRVGISNSSDTTNEDVTDTTNEDTTDTTNGDATDTTNEDVTDTTNEDTTDTTNGDATDTTNGDATDTTNGDATDTTNEDTSDTTTKDTSDATTDDTTDTTDRSDKTGKTKTITHLFSGAQTGDEMNAYGWLAVLMLSLVALFVLGKKKKW